MKMLFRTVAVFMLVITLSAISQTPFQSNDSKKHALAVWNRFVTEHFKVGQTEVEVEKLMANKFRDYGKIHYGGTGGYCLAYMIDDFNQISFTFDLHSKLTFLPVVAPKKPWLRYPDGTIVEIE